MALNKTCKQKNDSCTQIHVMFSFVKQCVVYLIFRLRVVLHARLDTQRVILFIHHIVSLIVLMRTRISKDGIVS